MSRLGFVKFDLIGLARAFLKLPEGSEIKDIRKAGFGIELTIDSPLFEENELPDQIPTLVTYRVVVRESV